MKNLKNIGILAVVIGILLLSGCVEEKIEITEEEEPEVIGPVYAGYGWSTNTDAIKAVEEAATLVKNLIYFFPPLVMIQRLF